MTAFGIAFSGTLQAQQARLSALPARPEPGAIIRLTLRGGAAGDSVVRVTGLMAGEPLHFSRTSAAAWSAIAGVPIDAAGAVTARAIVGRASGRTDTLSATVTVPRVRVATSKLKVDSTFSQPLDSATEARVASENARARDIGRRAHDTPRQWTRPFLQPRATAITSKFGTGRVFNGQVTSRHLGVDFEGAVGDTIRAANRGIVALVDNFFLAGNVVYIDHGVGVLTGYFHMSQPLVAVGDTVTRAQAIGLVGRTGRVTGPHLHWSARYGALAVNPLDLLAVP